MNFFDEQRSARQASRRLVVLFVLAVIGMVLVVNLAAALIYQFATRSNLAADFSAAIEFLWFRGHRKLPTLPASAETLPPFGFHVLCTVWTVGLIASGTLFQLIRLRAGGDVVARMVGARLVDPSSVDLLERRLLNVVEEMSVAAGVAVPRVYVIDNEGSINAFAAGHSVHDAVITVTHGTLTRLTRDELQGVVGHELSHILNGDMQLNLRLIGVLFGLLVVAMFGRAVMRVGSDGDDDRGTMFLISAGFALWSIGYLGVLFGRLIKAALSRQREFLADASAVQFTRNPDGIGGALRKIGGLSEVIGLGSEVKHYNAEVLSHMFLGAARSTFASGLFATHPPLAERLERIYGHPVDFMPAPELPLALGVKRATSTAAASPVSAFVNPPAGEMPTPEVVPAMVGKVSSEHHAYARDLVQQPTPPVLQAALLDATQAQLLVLAMLVEKEGEVGRQQRQGMVEAFGEEAAAKVDECHTAIQQLPPGMRLPLLDRAMPVLRKLPAASAERLLKLAHTLIVADGRVTLNEFLLYTILERRFGPDAQRRPAVKYWFVQDLQPDVALVLSLLASVRLPESPQRAFDAGITVLPNMNATMTQPSAISLDTVAAALTRLNQLAPSAKPAFIRICAATAFVDRETNWQAASCLRTICAAIDSPLPPQVLAVEADQPLPTDD